MRIKTYSEFIRTDKERILIDRKKKIAKLKARIISKNK